MIRAAIEGAATATLVARYVRTNTAAAAIAPAATAAELATATPETAAGLAPSETRECATAAGPEAVAAGAEKPAPAASRAVAASVAARASVAAAAVWAGETAFAGNIGRGYPVYSEKVAAAAATTGDDQRGVVARADRKAATTTAASSSAAGHDARASDGNLQDLARGQTEVTADLGAKTPTTWTALSTCGTAALRAKGEDLIGVGSRYRKIDEASGIGEVERYGPGGRS